MRVNWRFLAAAAIGFGFGNQLSQYLTSIFAPHLLKEFGWSKSQFALLGVSILVSIVVMPIVGRLTDIFGVRRMAAFGIICAPLVFVAYSAMSGSFAYFFLLNIVQHVLVGSTTTSTVYSRLIAEQFDRTRGLALSISACAPGAVTALSAPLLSGFIDAHGWRAGYLAMGLSMAIGGAIALLLIPARPSDHGKAFRSQHRSAARDYPAILRSRPFQVICAGMLLCNLTLMVQAQQLKLILLDKGASSAVASLLLSLYAVGIVVGRLCCGLALDRFRTHWVAAIALGMPAIGLLILVPGFSSTVLLSAAVLVIGLSAGAELDVTAYLVMRFFKVEIYSTVYGLVIAAIALAAASGSLLLSIALKLYGGYGAFLLLSAILTISGSALFMLLGRYEATKVHAAEIA